MDLNTLLILYEVVKHNSFSVAAKKLNMPSSNVSRKLQALESQLGVKLLNRTTRSVSATAEGKKVLLLAQGLLESNRQIKEWTLGQTAEARGVLKITAPESFTQWPLGDWLIEFQKRYPSVEIELVSDNSQLHFDDHDLDFAFRLGPLPNSNLIAKELFKVSFGFFASSDFLAQHGMPRKMEALMDLPSIGCTVENQLLPWMIEKAGQQQVILPNTCFRVKDQNIALKAAIQGLGVVFLPISLVERHSGQEQLMPVLKSYWPKPEIFYLVYRDKESVHSARHRAFVQFITQCLAHDKTQTAQKGISLDR